MTTRELFEKYDVCIFLKGIDLDAEAEPWLENALKESQEESEEYDRIVRERMKNND